MKSDNPIEQRYEADLLGNIQQALAGLQGFEVMALELIQNADDAGAAEIEALVNRCFDSADYAEGRRAFMAKRVPQFKGH